LLNKENTFTATNTDIENIEIKAPKLPSALQEILDNIEDQESLVLVLVKKLFCDSDTPVEQQLKERMVAHPKVFHYYSICYRPHELQFPEPATDMVYIFEPKSKWFSMTGQAQGFAQHFNSIIETVEKRQQEAQKPLVIDKEQEQNQIEMLQNESLDKFPTVFQQTRNLLKTGWDIAKGLANNRVLLVSAEVANARLSTCENCNFYKEKRCIKCGCFMEQKVHLHASSCPLNKW
jgi:hypothetical protein